MNKVLTEELSEYELSVPYKRDMEVGIDHKANFDDANISYAYSC